ncbi:U4/U6 small nuclear ribonucleoprotein Prp3, putative [Entamoeba invadens IP1]|uniref:U4/U6 small nuclear ribonucleoprotein Prp3, putative n=1 Tax=Entamoeba invadens IP1 TaxID=370355 RepID=UPI0002C3DB0C|nr:U4/U6 small nuclear ribonucleoprotein Prp3, putative [Entamoeba invadens IP1]ELP93306.1 U4/U6 small nuclear ribonucleoprotein Prp3, putative [Entamoeba invadens IP1]|eukprot:XP_004260077.1 U4/U6 small nuclear ribonucleoprotein Prp3, putative [Entamoeba invadens IP1]
MADKSARIAELKARLAKRKVLSETITTKIEKEAEKKVTKPNEALKAFLSGGGAIKPIKRKAALDFDIKSLAEKEEELKAARIKRQLIFKGVLKGDETSQIEGIAPFTGDIEWWDAPFISDKTSTPHTSYPEIDNSEIEKVLEGKDSKVLAAQINRSVEHPATSQIVTSGDIQVKTILTKQEMKKMRKLRREEEHEKERDEILMGLRQAPPDKLKFSNMAKIFPEEIVTNPSEVERRVKEAMDQRREKHEKDNNDRKLTKSERKKKEWEKMMKEREEGLLLNVFKVDKTDGQKFTKLWQVAKELCVTGFAFMFNEKLLIVAEGSKKSIVKYEGFCTKRMKWVVEDEDQGSKYCNKIWEGKSDKSLFTRFACEKCEKEESVLDILRLKGLEFLWKLMKCD